MKAIGLGGAAELGASSVFFPVPQPVAWSLSSTDLERRFLPLYDRVGSLTSHPVNVCNGLRD